MIWIEAAKDLKWGKRLAKNLARYNEGQFVVFDRRKKQVVASFNESGAKFN